MRANAGDSAIAAPVGAGAPILHFLPDCIQFDQMHRRQQTFETFLCHNYEKGLLVHHTQSLPNLDKVASERLSKRWPSCPFRVDPPKRRSDANLKPRTLCGTSRSVRK